MTESKSRVAVVTGAGSGIGRAVALGLHAAGYSVVLAGRRASALEDTASRATSGERLRIKATDVSDSGSVRDLFADVTHAYGRIDVLFNNAGIFPPAAEIDALSLDDWQRAVSINLTGAFLCAREAYALMKAQTPRGGRIINNGSISAHAPRPQSIAYTATKHAITGLTKSLCLDGRAHDIACSQIDIGNAETELTSKMAAGILQADGRITAEPRMDVSHVADAVLYIAGLPLDANVPFMTLMATAMPYIGRG